MGCIVFNGLGGLGGKKAVVKWVDCKKAIQ